VRIMTLKKLKSLVYPLLPSSSERWHAKRRKGLFYRHVDAGTLECQREQDRIFWTRFLQPEKKGHFAEFGGNGVIGSHTLGLELLHGWEGTIQVEGKRPRKTAATARSCRIIGEREHLLPERGVDLVAIHRPSEFPMVWEDLQPRWVIVENREPDPQWCRLLERSGYRLRFFFQDDEYFQLTSS